MNNRSFASVDAVLAKVTSKLGLDRRLREHTLLELWRKLIGEPFASRSRALFMDTEAVLVIATADASTAQEMSMMKRQLMVAVSKAAKAVGLEVKGIRFDLKRFNQRFESDVIGVEPDPMPLPSEEDLLNTALVPDDLANYERLKGSLSLDEGEVKLSERILRVFERELQLRRWRLNQGFPVCALCHEPVWRLHPLKEDEKIGVCTLCVQSKFAPGQSG